MDILSDDGGKARHGDQATELAAESILLEEFRHNNTLMYQHRESINSLFSFYLTLVSVIVSGVGVAAYAYQQNNEANGNLLLAIAGVLIMLAILSFAFYTLFRNLRQAYQDSLAAMEQIKEFYLTAFMKQMPQLPQAFFWRQNTRRHALGGDSRVMNWTTRLVGSYSFGQALWIVLIFLLDHVLKPYNQLQDVQETLIKIGAAAGGFVVAFVVYPLLYRAFARPPQVQEFEGVD